VYTIVVHPWEASIQTGLLDHHVLPDNQAVGSHVAQIRQNAVDVLVGVDERNHDGQFASGFDQMGGVDFAASEEAGFGVEGDAPKTFSSRRYFRISRCGGAGCYWCATSLACIGTIPVRRTAPRGSTHSRQV